MSTRKFHREKCQSFIRRTPFILYRACKANQVTIIIGGRHAFEWSVIIQTPYKVESIILPNRHFALEEFEKQKRKYQFGDIYH